MSSHKYVDDSGNVVQFVQTNIPGLTFVPPGFEEHEAIPVAPTEAAVIVQHFEDEGKKFKPVDVRAELAKLQVDVDNQKQTISAQADEINKLKKTKPL